ncbi:MAG TPA: TetR/AcrR family transcriptional regulator [Blastocatellia bacterium]|nr:TetR/AcrR family transcriptional regulator [Blastocatellia bacterium]
MKTSTAKVVRPRGRPRSFDRDAALEHAMQLFWRHGYEATSISELTAAMGITPPSLYAAFGDKERLFLEAIERYTAGPGNSVAMLAGASSARGAIEGLLTGACDELTNPGHPPGCMVVTAATNCSESSAHLQSALAKMRAANEARIRTTIERGVAEGELPQGTDSAALAKFFMTVLQGMTIQARDGAARDALLTVAHAAMNAWPVREHGQRPGTRPGPTSNRDGSQSIL